MEGLVKSIFEPGVNQSLLVATNVAFFFLLLVLVLVAVFVEFNVHVVFLLILSTLLWAGINWFIIELSSVPPPPEAVDGDDTQKTDTVSGALPDDSDNTLLKRSQRAAKE